MLRIVTAYTPDYAELANRLIDSAELFKVPISAYAFESRGSWKANCAAKPEMILRAMKETGDDCLWLDADMYLRGWPTEWPAGDVLLKFSDPPEAQVFDFTLKRNVPNTQTKLTPWGGHMLWRRTSADLLFIWRAACNEFGTITNDEQCLIHAMQHFPALSIGPLNPWFIVHTPAGREHGKPTEAEGWI